MIDYFEAPIMDVTVASVDNLIANYHAAIESASSTAALAGAPEAVR